jgi:hypothetical protein
MRVSLFDHAFKLWEGKAMTAELRTSKPAAKTPGSTEEPDWTGIISREGAALLSAPEMATRFNVDAAALHQRLRRWRESKDNRHLHGKGWVENADAGSTQARFVYRVAESLPLVRELWQKENPAHRT